VMESVSEGSGGPSRRSDPLFALRVIAVFLVIAVLVIAARSTTTHRTNITVAGTYAVVDTQLPGRLVGAFTTREGIKGQVMVGGMPALIAALNRGDVDAFIATRDVELDQLVFTGRLLPFLPIGSMAGGTSVYGVYTVPRGVIPSANAGRAAAFRMFAGGPDGRALVGLLGAGG
jgi:hypothetical protein